MKVHFAGEGGSKFGPSYGLLKAGIKYRLQSFYDINVRNAKFDIEIVNMFRHTIIDSGLFTMMFGSESKKGISQEQILKWMGQYIKFINETPFENASFVECDVQKKLSSEYAWELRKEMKSKINKGTVINVYHLEDENPDKLIDFSDYIAISLPELRFNVSEKERFNITKYIANKAVLKNKKVHLLGCTEMRYLKEFSHCFSCDSTSWQSSFRFGSIKTKENGNISISEIRNQKEEEKIDHINDVYWSALFARIDYKKLSKNQE